jgi:hypothetical protein
MAVDRFPVEEGSILLFARSIGDPNPIYADPDHAAGTEVGGIIAQFDPDYPLRPQLGEPWFGSGGHPTGRVPAAEPSGSGGRGTGLHAEQHYEYHRPLRVGDVLSAVNRPGESWEKQGRSGKLVFSESVTEYRDAEGELVVTARAVSVMTERAVTTGD